MNLQKVLAIILMPHIPEECDSQGIKAVNADILNHIRVYVISLHVS